MGADDDDVPSGLRASRGRIAGRSVVVLSYPVGEPVPDPRELLTIAEREVYDHLLAGLSRSEIASLRKTSTRTINKQIDSIYRKLSVCSRAELAATAIEGE